MAFYYVSVHETFIIEADGEDEAIAMVANGGGSQVGKSTDVVATENR